MANLILWVSLAVALSLVLSDEVDLGVETLLRERQATAVALWGEVPRATERTIGAAQPADEPPARTPVFAVEATPSRSNLTPKVPQVKVSPPPDGTATNQEPARAGAFSSAPATPQPSAEPESTLAASPLLMADPGFSNPTSMNQRMAESAVGRVVQIRYSEEALNQEIQALLQNNPKLPYRNVTLDLKRDRAVVFGQVSALGLELDAEIVGTVAAEDCLPHMTIESIAVEGVFTPNFVKNQIRKLILDALNWYPPDYPLCLQQIVLEEDGVTVYGYRR